MHSSDLTTESVCCSSTGPPAASTKPNSAGSAKKDASSTQLCDMPMESQIQELNARCFLPSLLERVETPGWRLGFLGRGTMPLSLALRMLLAQKDARARTCLWRVPRHPDDPGFQGNLSQSWAVLLHSPAVNCKEELRGQVRHSQQRAVTASTALAQFLELCPRAWWCAAVLLTLSSGVA